MDSKALCVVFLIALFTMLPELTQSKIIDPEQRIQAKENKTTDLPSQSTTAARQLQVHVVIEPTTAAPKLQSIPLVPKRSRPSRHTVKKCCKVGQWAATRGYFCYFDNLYYREFRNMEHRQRMKFHGKEVVPFIDRQVVRRIRRCVDHGLKTITSRCCRYMVEQRERYWSDRLLKLYADE